MEDRSSRRVRTLVTRMAHRGLSANEIARALISMMVGSNDKLQSETGYIDARPHPPDRRNLLQRTAGPYIWVIRVDSGLLAFGGIADINSRGTVAMAQDLTSGDISPGFDHDGRARHRQR
jgi:hypothetical protein